MFTDRRHRPLFAALTALVSIVPVTGRAQTVDSAHVAAADASYRSRRWNEAVAAYGALVGADARNSLAWYRLGIASLALADTATADSALRRTVRLVPLPSAMLTLAAIAAGRAPRDSALAWVTRAADAGLRAPDALMQNPAFDGLRNDSRFAAALATIRRNNDPCGGVEHHALDFWIGRWEVREATGRVAGTSTVEPILGGCALHEVWDTGPGDRGESLNAYDPVTRTWKQFWVDSRGRVTQYLDGEFSEGRLRFPRSAPTAGARILRLTFTLESPDQVRQFAEESRDGGKSWATRYDLYYGRVRP